MVFWFLFAVLQALSVVSIKTIGVLVNEPTEATVGTYSLQGVQGCEAAIASFSSQYRCILLTMGNETNSFTRFSYLFQQDPTIVQAISMLEDPDNIRKLALQYPNILFSENSVQALPTDPPNVEGIIFNRYQSIFLAGVAAGAVTKTNNVGVITNFGFLNYFIDMYLRGVLYVNPIATVQYAVTQDPTWSNATLGADMAKQQIENGADVLFGAAGTIGDGGIYYAASQKLWVIGVDQDESKTFFTNKSDPASQYIIGSAVFDAQHAVQEAVSEFIKGTPYSGNKVFDVTNGGVRFADCASAITCERMNQTFTFIDTSTANVNIQSLSVKDLLKLITTRMKVGSLVLPSVANGALQPYLLNNGSWEQLLTFGHRPVQLYSHSFTSLGNGNFLVFGGQTALGDVNNDLYNLNFDVSDFGLVKLAPNSPKPKGVAYHSAGLSVATNELIVFGGSLASGEIIGDTWGYSALKNTWTNLGNLGGPGTRSYHSYATFNDNMFIFGGQDSTNSQKSDLWVLNIPNRQWSLLAATSATGQNGPIPLSFSAMVVANSSTLFMFGGSDGITDYANLWAFDLDGKSWQLLSPDTSEYKPTGRSHMVALMLDQRRILFVGGVSQSIPQIQSFIYNTALNKYQLDSHLNLPEGTQGMAGFAYNQSSYENACAYGAAPICSPINQTAVVIYGGSKPGTGVSGTMLIAFPNPEIMPKPPMEITFTIKTIGITIASIGIVFCAAMSIVLTVFHKHPAFKSASIMFLSFYLLGAVVALTGMIIYSKQEVKASSCTAALFTFSTGCSILYSSIFLKNLRIILIFRVKGSSLKRYLGDTYFGPALLVLVLINIGVLIGFVVNAPYKESLYISAGDVWPICASDDIDKWMWILLIPTGLCILGSLYISFETRNVSSRFNEAGLINSSIYVTILSLLILIALDLTLKLPSTQAVLTEVIASIAIISVIAINFVPKLMEAAFKTTEDILKLSIAKKTTHGQSESSEVEYSCRYCKQPLQAKKSSVNQSQMDTTSMRASSSNAGPVLAKGYQKVQTQAETSRKQIP